MNVLAVDTSSEAGSVALVRDGDVVGEIRLAAAIHHSELLFEAIDFLFRHGDTSLDQIDVFAAARGPGSFTGLRVGLAAMEGFAFAKGKPSTGVSTLAALAWTVGATDRLIAPVLDARRGEIYGALFRRRDQELIELRAPAVLKPAEWFRSLPSEPVVFCGGAAPGCRSWIDGQAPWETVSVSPYLASAVAAMAAAGKGEAPAPLYIRPTSAEAGRSGVST